MSTTKHIRGLPDTSAEEGHAESTQKERQAQGPPQHHTRYPLSLENRRNYKHYQQKHKISHAAKLLGTTHSKHRDRSMVNGQTTRGKQRQPNRYPHPDQEHCSNRTQHTLCKNQINPCLWLFCTTKEQPLASRIESGRMVGSKRLGNVGRNRINTNWQWLNTL